MGHEQPYSLFRLVRSTLVALSYEIDSNHINIEATEKRLLIPGNIDKITRRITEAIRLKLAFFLMSGKEFTVTK